MSPSITMVGDNPTTRWFRDPVMTIGSDAHGYRLCALLGAAGGQSTGGLWLQIGSKSLRLDNGNSSDSNNKLMTDKYPSTIGIGYSKAVIPVAPGVLESFVDMFKGQAGFIAPTPLVQNEDGTMKAGYEGLKVVGTVTLEQMMDLPATSVSAPRTGRKASTPAVELTEEQLQAKLDAIKVAKEAIAKAEADAKAAKLAEAKRLLAEAEKAESEMNGDEKVAATTKKDFAGKSSKAPIK